MSALSQFLPKERRETLKKLFGLEKYADFERISKNRFDEARHRIEALEKVNATLEPDVEKIPEVLNDVEKIKKGLKILEAKKETQLANSKKADEVRDDLEKKFRGYELLEQEAAGISKNIDELILTIKSTQAQISHLIKVRDELPDLQRNYTTFS